ncbi:5-formyltetrahydrofolate cyclo-ligase [Candidatus Curtissbacteria bacterium]|nr:5-formyltetrahydrofolate cyclo-ligase [Candidatus Curtissbacteria bacterium]
MDSTDLKLSLRKQYIDRRNKLSEEEFLRKSERIEKRVLDLDEMKKAKSVSCYISINNEVDTAQIINSLVKKGVLVYVPKYFYGKWVFSRFESWEKMQGGYKNIFEPEDLILADSDFDVSIIPGVAFDKNGVRLGYGLGVFDKLLAGSKAYKIGLAHDFQIVDEIPREKHDLVMGMVVTERRTLVASG